MRERGTFYTLKWQGRRGIKLKSLEYIDNGIFHSLFLTGLDYTLGIFARLIWVSSNLFARPGYAPCKSILLYISLSSLLLSFFVIYIVIDSEILSRVIINEISKIRVKVNELTLYRIVYYTLVCCTAWENWSVGSDKFLFYREAKN